MICNATKQELMTAGLSILANCTVDGCGFPVARHRDDPPPATQPGNYPVPVNSIVLFTSHIGRRYQGFNGFGPCFRKRDRACSSR